MPTPHPERETRSQYIRRCKPVVKREGTAKNDAQATAVCISYWEDATEDKNNSEKKSMKSLNRQMFRTVTTREAPTRVDRNHNVIFGARIIRLGALNDERPYVVDEGTLDNVVALGNRPKQGLKARFTHENLSDDGLARHMGRWKNFRREGDAILADLYLADVAFDTPEGDLGNYILDLAEEDPDSFGVSLATKFAKEMQEDREEEDQGKPRPLRFERIHSADFVGTPAATDGLFSDPSDERNLPAVATQIMDHFFSNNRPEEVMERFQEFLNKYYGGEMNTMPETNVQDTKSGASVEDQTQVQATPDQGQVPQESAASDDPAHTRFVQAFGEKGALWYLEGKSFEECLQARVAEQDSKIEKLATQNEDLQNKLDAALSASGEQDPLSAEPESTPRERKKAQQLEHAKKKGVSDAAAQWSSSLYGDKDQQ